MHAAVRDGTPSLTSLAKDGDVSCKVRPPRSPIRSLTSLDQAQLQLLAEDCISHSATHPVRALLEHSTSALLEHGNALKANCYSLYVSSDFIALCHSSFILSL